MGRTFKSVTTTINEFSAVPREVMIEILKNLLPNEINELAKTAKQYNLVINHPQTVEFLYQSRGYHHFQPLMNLDNIKSDFMQMHNSFFAGLPVEVKQCFLDAQVSNLSRFQEKVNTTDLDILTLQDNKQNSLLHWAALNGNLEFMQYLINQGHDLNSRNADGDTPMHFAAKVGKSAAVKLLLNHGALLAPKDNHDKSPLMQAFLNNHKDVMLVLLQRGADVDTWDPRTSDTLLMLAIRNNDAAMVEFLLQRRANIRYENTAGVAPIHYAALGNDPKILELICQHALVDIEHKTVEQGATAVLHAAFAGSLDNLQVLKRAGAKLDVRDSSNQHMLHYAAAAGKVNFIRKVINDLGYPCSADADGDTPLHLAATSGDADSIAELYDYDNAQLTTTNHNGNLPIHSLIEKSDSTAGLSYFLNIIGFDLEAPNVQGQTPLLLAAKNNKLDLVNTLLTYNVNFNARDNANKTALMHAAAANNPEILRLLLTKDHDINAQDANGNTALHIACEQDNFEAIRLLKAAGADHNIRNVHGFMPLDLSSPNNQVDIARILLGDDLAFEFKKSFIPVMKFMTFIIQPSYIQGVNRVAKILRYPLAIAYGASTISYFFSLHMSIVFKILAVAACTILGFQVASGLVVFAAVIAPIAMIPLIYAGSLLLNTKPILQKTAKLVCERMFDFAKSVLGIEPDTKIILGKSPLEQSSKSNKAQTGFMRNTITRAKVFVAKCILRVSAFFLGIEILPEPRPEKASAPSKAVSNSAKALAGVAAKAEPSPKSAAKLDPVAGYADLFYPDSMTAKIEEKPVIREKTELLGSHRRVISA